MNKFIKALARHELALTRVKSLGRQIGEAVSKCPIDIRAMSGEEPAGEYHKLWVDGGKHTKTHLWQAFQHLEPSDCGYGMVHLDADGIADSLSEGSSYECQHCLRAWELICERKEAKADLGRARLSIRALGRQAVKLMEAEQCDQS